jgi:hypothetical protein
MVAPQPKIIAHEESEKSVMRRGVKEAKKEEEEGIIQEGWLCPLN